ncbi:MAG: hypothetical protein NC417_04385 [Candidatus Gastranaerophilales bacterium]|nr:hypothetical protein [Candidatus Gastranaerophilales bacterium]
MVEKKGVDIAQIGKKIDGNIKNSGNYDTFHNSLIAAALSDNDLHKQQAALLEEKERELESLRLEINK